MDKVELSEKLLRAILKNSHKKVVDCMIREYSREIDSFPVSSRKRLAERTMLILFDVIDQLDEKYDVGWNRETDDGKHN